MLAITTGGGGKERVEGEERRGEEGGGKRERKRYCKAAHSLISASLDVGYCMHKA